MDSFVLGKWKENDETTGAIAFDREMKFIRKKLFESW
jgi:hypothetical protein